MEKQLSQLPKGLYETYDRILEKIDEQDIGDVKTFLQWCAFSARPMTLAEIAQTITVDFESEDLPVFAPKRRYWDQQDVMEKCSSLVIEAEGCCQSIVTSMSS